MQVRDIGIGHGTVGQVQTYRNVSPAINLILVHSTYDIIAISLLPSTHPLFEYAKNKKNMVLLFSKKQHQKKVNERKQSLDLINTLIY